MIDSHVALHTDEAQEQWTSEGHKAQEKTPEGVSSFPKIHRTPLSSTRRFFPLTSVQTGFPLIVSPAFIIPPLNQRSGVTGDPGSATCDPVTLTGLSVTTSPDAALKALIKLNQSNPS
ncbi:uncharacterized protein V6R79_000147 [Siganus canaliculatus]